MTSSRRVRAGPPAADSGGCPDFTTQAETIAGGAWRLRLLRADNGRPLSWDDVIALWRDGGAPSDRFSAALAQSPHKAFFWETPPLTQALRTSVPFECITLDAPHLASAAPDPHTFAAHTGARRGQAGAMTFSNLAGDARLVAPCEDAEAAKVGGGTLRRYVHLAAFLRGADAVQVRALWAEAARALEDTLATRGPAPTWVNTEGSGVSWLHLRLDSRPKYVHWGPYRAPPETPVGGGGKGKDV
eukprot:CAMPEP_0206031980 /NCGR_PEP_ID=MMETSP1464-20131121/48290_1 /ASSEMBLY_ACC=CAM_ASM_001124 /TAXON_ID=119497 /ORGANISM="Exanthemachrysis gayraliae, Strain RCC1523" /LENGTH=243 /DNA_ID=CAMNT_0053406091 /DNA_START=43 /DNA_END=774 /DNA_ORIENTATION=+